MSLTELHNAFAAVVLIVAGCSLWMLDALLAREHREHIAEWYADGQPVGPVWRPPNVGWMSKDVTRGRLVAFREPWSCFACTVRAAWCGCSASPCWPRGTSRSGPSPDRVWEARASPHHE